MISVYDRLETNFTHNGIVLPDVISCTIEEVLNGKLLLELTHPLDEKGRWEHLAEENIIKADGQLFRIHSTDSNLGYVYVNARHIFYDLLHNFLEDVRPTNINGAGALNWILSNTQYPHDFIGMSDISTLNTQYFIRKNPVEAMLGTDSLVTRWNGELVRDNYTIRLLNSRGQNKGAQIAYGKNMLGLEVKRDMDSVITRIMPVGRDGLLLPEKYIDSPLINNYVLTRIQKLNFDIGVDEETTQEQAFIKLRQACNDLYNKNKVDIPYININANLLMLEHTEEYKHIKNLVKVDLGDVVSCTDNPLKITFEAKVIRIKKDVLSNKNVEVELGQFKKGIGSTIQNAINDISELVKNTTSDLEKAINNATELLTNALGGYVVKIPGELLIMDTEDVNTATKIWRWNVNGLGYSKTGINGPYGLAMTMDGQIVADFITTGTLSAGLIKTGVLASADNSSFINMDDGSFNFKNQLVWDKANNKLILGSGVKLSWGSVTDQPTILSGTDVTTITNSTISTTNVVAQNLQVKSANITGVLSANQIATNISQVANTLYVGNDDTNGSIILKNGSYIEANNFGTVGIGMTIGSAYMHLSAIDITLGYASSGYTTFIGNVDLSNANSVLWGSNAPTARFG